MIYLSLASLPNHRPGSMKWKLLPWKSHQSLWIFWMWRKKEDENLRLTWYSCGGSGSVRQKFEALLTCQLMWMPVVKTQLYLDNLAHMNNIGSVCVSIWMFERPLLFFLRLFHIIWWSDFDSEEQFVLCCKHGHCLKMSGCDDRMGSLCLRARSVEVKLMVKGDNYWTRKCAIV